MRSETHMVNCLDYLSKKFDVLEEFCYLFRSFFNLFSVCPLFPAGQVLGEVQEVVKTGVWVGDCFIYTSSVNRLSYYVGGEIITIAHMDR